MISSLILPSASHPNTLKVVIDCDEGTATDNQRLAVWYLLKPEGLMQDGLLVALVSDTPSHHVSRLPI